MRKKSFLPFSCKFMLSISCSLLLLNSYTTKVFASTSNSPIPAWNSNNIYNENDTVEYKGQTYKAKWWTKEFAPDTKVENPWDTPWELFNGSTVIIPSADKTNSETSEDKPSSDTTSQTPTDTKNEANAENDTITDTNTTATSWKSDIAYNKYDIVEYKGQTYRAKWWTKDFIPDTKVENSWDTPWELFDGSETNVVDNGGASSETPSDTSSNNSSNSVVYPDYSKVDVGDGIEFPDSIFAPFVDATAWPPFKLSEASMETSVPFYNLGFVVSKSASVCEPSWGTYYTPEEGPLNAEIKKIRQMGGDVIVSFGGAANTPLHVSAPNAEVLKEQYKRFIKAYKLTRIDFDIEGTWVQDIPSLKRNNEALKLLQSELKAEGYNLDIWFTLPVLPTGLDNNGLNAAKMAIEDGVILDGVNVMTMDYGDSTAPNPSDKMGEYGIQAITSLHNQLKQLYSNINESKTDSELWKMIGTTPMIGMNDVQSEIFNLEDARQTVEFAKSKGLGMISMWSANRDQANSKGAINYVEIGSSSIAQEKFEFSKIFTGFNTTKINTEANLPIDNTTDEDNSSSTDDGSSTSSTENADNSNTSSSTSAWESDKTYNTNDIVEYKGHTYRAKWWTKEFAPDTVVENPWETPWMLIK